MGDVFVALEKEYDRSWQSESQGLGRGESVHDSKCRIRDSVPLTGTISPATPASPPSARTRPSNLVRVV